MQQEMSLKHCQFRLHDRLDRRLFQEDVLQMSAKRFLGITLAIVLTTGLGAAHAELSVGASATGVGATPVDPIFTFDEFGIGNVDGVPMVSVVGPDPSSSLAAVLIYTLPFDVGVGDVGVWEGTDHSLPFSDGIRFTNANGDIDGAVGNLLIFYSDNADGTDAPADSGLPSNFGSGATGEPVEEESDGTFLFVAGDNQYHGISDAPEVVPEPSTLAIVGLSGLSMIVVFRRRRATA